MPVLGVSQCSARDWTIESPCAIIYIESRGELPLLDIWFKPQEKEESMATQVELYKRILDAMGDDAEVAELCRKHINRAEQNSAKTAAKMDEIKRFMRNHTGEYAEKTAREIAVALNARGGTGNWSTRGAAYYLSSLVKEGLVNWMDSKGSARKYYWVKSYEE